MKAWQKPKSRKKEENTRSRVFDDHDYEGLEVLECGNDEQRRIEFAFQSREAYNLGVMCRDGGITLLSIKVDECVTNTRYKNKNLKSRAMILKTIEIDDNNWVKEECSRGP